MPATSATDSPIAVVAERQRVEAIAADAVGRLPRRGEIEAGYLRKRRGEQAPLNQAGFFELPLLFRVAALRRARLIDLALQDLEERHVFPWLLDEALRAPPHRLHGRIDAAPAGHDDDRHRGIVRAHVLDQLEPLSP